MKALARMAVLAAIAFATGALAQSGYPDHPIRFVVPFTAGSGTDIVARTVGEHMSRTLGQPIVIENRPGAGGTVGAAAVAKSAPDGYTLLVHSAGHVANAAIYKELPYDTLKDFAGVTPLASLPNVLIVAPAKGYKSVKDLVANAQQHPGALNYGSAGNGSATHMNAEIFRQSAKFDAQHVPYKGTPEAMTEVMTGRIDFYFAPLSSALPLIQGGRVQALAVGTAKRSPLLPDVPTTLEAGYPGSDYVFWVALLAPAATPRAIVDKLNAAALKALADPAIHEKLRTLGAEPMPMAPAAFDAFLRDETAHMAQVVKAAGIKAQ
ncbi:MAG TPA: tripartite tricarboxylate transporter substrate binding protein [Usitatibacter sp.]|jgi:tripartite-type tricarboxylate transporter receptor subunit TctC|nr:tripartite tricarboxylate transporter substrate binding protein [Usitatibacter sp.]